MVAARKTQNSSEPKVELERLLRRGSKTFGNQSGEDRGVSPGVHPPASQKAMSFAASFMTFVNDQYTAERDLSPPETL
jgi:hypothetical protein